MAMGFFARLPPELRLTIWEDYLNSTYPTYAFGDTTIEGLGLLRTCRQIYEETSDLIYERGTFTFGIRPPIPNYNFDGGSYSAAVRSTWIRRWRFHFPDDDPVFRYIPYERIGEINIEIEAPYPSDRGQIMALWRKAKRLVDLLSKAGSLMNSKYISRTQERDDGLRMGIHNRA
jgi:hypothetical protein